MELFLWRFFRYASAWEKMDATPHLLQDRLYLVFLENVPNDRIKIPPSYLYFTYIIPRFPLSTYYDKGNLPMNRCIPYDRLFSFKEGLLPAKEKHAVQTHLDGCAHCRRELDQIAQVVEVIEQNPIQERVQTPKRLLNSALAMIPIPEKQSNPAPRPSGTMEGLRKIMARWITPEPTHFALARSLSSAKPTKRHLYEAEDLEIALGIKRQKNGQWAILGELFPETSSGDAMLFLRDGTESRRAPLEASQFGFYDVEEGKYVVQIQYGNQVIEIGDVCVTSNEE